MLDFETPTYVSAKEAQHMQSQVNQGLINTGSYSGDLTLHVDSLECFSRTFSDALTNIKKTGLFLDKRQVMKLACKS